MKYAKHSGHIPVSTLYVIIIDLGCWSASTMFLGLQMELGGILLVGQRTAKPIPRQQEEELRLKIHDVI